MNRQLAARAEAAAWITRLHGPNRTGEMEAGFRQWLDESAENRIEFEALTDIWATVGSVPAVGAPRLERWEHSAESQELQELRSTHRELTSRWRRTSHSWRRIGVRSAAAAAMVLTIALVASWPLRNQIEPSYATAVGETRMVQLPDKSRVWMNSDSRVRVAFDSRQRRVELIRGEAFFEVAKNVRRSFVVKAGERYVTALGTSFLVRHEPDHTAVTLVEGKVAISPSPQLSENALQAPSGSSAVGASPWILSAGQRLTLVSAGAAKIDEPSVESVLAWRRGEVVLIDTPMHQAVSEMNRYDKTTIVIEGPAIEALSVSGLYHTGDNQGFARSIAKLYRLDLEERDGRIYLKSQ
jgi:transmembrane sensor